MVTLVVMQVHQDQLAPLDLHPVGQVGQVLDILTKPLLIIYTEAMVYRLSHNILSTLCEQLKCQIIFLHLSKSLF